MLTRNEPFKWTPLHLQLLLHYCGNHSQFESKQYSWKDQLFASAELISNGYLEMSIVHPNSAQKHVNVTDKGYKTIARACGGCGPKIDVGNMSPAVAEQYIKNLVAPDSSIANYLDRLYATRKTSEPAPKVAIVRDSTVFPETVFPVIKFIRRGNKLVMFITDTLACPIENGYLRPARTVDSLRIHGDALYGSPHCDHFTLIVDPYTSKYPRMMERMGQDPHYMAIRFNEEWMCKTDHGKVLAPEKLSKPPEFFANLPGRYKITFTNPHAR